MHCVTRCTAPDLTVGPSCCPPPPAGSAPPWCALSGCGWLHWRWTASRWTSGHRRTACHCKSHLVNNWNLLWCWLQLELHHWLFPKATFESQKIQHLLINILQIHHGEFCGINLNLVYFTNTLKCDSNERQIKKKTCWLLYGSWFSFSFLNLSLVNLPTVCNCEISGVTV